MSARFGRNQRRKLLAEVAQRDAEIARLGRVASQHYDDKIRHLRSRERLEVLTIDWAERIANLLGPHSAFAKDLARETTDAALMDYITQGRPYRVEPVRNLSWNAMRPGNPTAVRDAERTIETFANIANAEWDALRFAVRFELVGPDGAYVLMMDERTRQALTSQGDASLTRYLIDRLLSPWMKGPKA